MTLTPETSTHKLGEPLSQEEAIASLGRYGYGWVDSDVAGAGAQRGLSEAVVRDISAKKNEPDWMLQNRLKALRIFRRKPMPNWGSNLEGIDFDNIKYFVRSTEKQAASWDDLPEDIKNTYDRLGIPEAEKQRLVAGVAAQYECLAGDTLVWTANRGQVPIKDITHGDRVFSYDESAERFVVASVKASAQTDTRLTYAVTTARRSIRATENHPMLVLRDERKPGRQRARYARRWLTVGEIEPGDFIAVPRRIPEFGTPAELPTIAGFMSPSTSSVDLMWLLGLYVGGGDLHLSTRTYRVQFAIPATDAQFRAEVAGVVEDLFGLRCVQADEYRIAVNSKALTQWIVELGFAGSALIKRVPDWVYSLPVDQRLAFLGGWVDADGFLNPGRSSSVRLTCANEALLNQARELVELSGLCPGGPWSHTQPYRHAAVHLQIGWRLGISGQFERLGCRDPKRISGFGRRRHSHSSNGEHGTTIRVHGNDWLGFERVESVDPHAVEPVYDIEVDGPHNFLAAGLVAHNSEVVYHKIRDDLQAQGVIFLDTDTGLKEHEKIYRDNFGTVIPAGDNKFSALNTAVWSGGSFIYVPPGVHVDIPLQAYFRINTENMGQFERTLIIVDEGAYVHYVEGCTAPVYSSDSLHSAVVEIIVKRGGRCRYTTIQNWSANVYNLVTKRARAEAGATMEWIDGNIGSKVTMKYPAVWMTGEHAKGEVLSVAFAGEGQHQDTGAKMLHLAPNTSSNIVSKSVARGGGRASYRGLVQVNKGAHGSRSSVKCDALLVDSVSRSDTYPYVDIREDDVTMGHEATVSKVSEDQLFYLMSRGMTEDEAMAMVVRGFVEPIAKELPMEYALELNRLIELQMEGAVG
ncbi:MAG: Fe-S cluster assembly protein SufB [Mycobacteriaceae bacterium]|nr:Fe-S cluster assembly protein SufB [Mycobacteriaceae bacterium]